MMLHDISCERGVRDATTIKVLTPMSMPIPISTEASAAILAGLAERGHRVLARDVVTSLDPATKTGDAAATVARSTTTCSSASRCTARRPWSSSRGWRSTAGSRSTTRRSRRSFPNVYAVGDVTSAPVPRVGVIAEGEAGTVADVLDPPLARRRRPRAVSGHRHLLHRVRRRRGREVRRQLPRWAVAVRGVQTTVRRGSPRPRPSSVRPGGGAGSVSRA